MKKILIDMDILTIGLWEKGDARKADALKFIKRAEAKEFFVYFLDEHMKVVSEWKHEPLKNAILEKIIELQDRFVELSDVLARIENKTHRKAEEFVDEFTRFAGSKKADILLVLACSALEIDYLVTFNRKHLQTKKAKIEEFLRRNKMYVPKIVLANEI